MNLSNMCSNINHQMLSESLQQQLRESNLGKELLKIFALESLTSVFQPIVDIKTQKVYAVESLSRGPEGSPLFAPLSLFSTASDHGCLFEMDWLARRKAIEAFREQALVHKNEVKLFLNVSVNLFQQSTEKGLTLACLKELGIPPEQVVIELTELQPVEDYDSFLSSIQHYREMGFSVAIDDLGSGYNGLRIWSEVRPDFVKIDRHFVMQIDQNPNKQKFLETMITLADSLGTRLIAEGVETEKELAVLERLGVHYVQGYLFGRPQKEVILSPEYQWPKRAKVFAPEADDTVAHLIKYIEPVTDQMSVMEMARLLSEHQSLEYVPVVRGEGKPVGIVWRKDFFAILAKPYVKELYSRKNIQVVMDMNPFVFDIETPLVEVSQKVTENTHDREISAFLILKEGRYHGCVDFLDLLKSLTQLQIKSAQYANPLSGLPGNVPIQNAIKRYIEHGEPFVLIYVDVDNFKPFNDYYSFELGDQVITQIAEILKSLSQIYPSFIGHIGGDDFVVIMEAGEDYEGLCQALLEQFRAQVESLYTEEDRERGGILTANRDGDEQFFPIMSLSLGVLVVDPTQVSHLQQLAMAATKTKKLAKNKGGNSYYIGHLGEC